MGEGTGMPTIVVIQDTDPQQAEKLTSLLQALAIEAISTVSGPYSAPSAQTISSAWRSELTPRECELVAFQLQYPRMTWSAIARDQKTTRKTIKTYYQRIYRKVGVGSRDELIATIIQRLVPAEPVLYAREVGTYV